VNMNFPTNLLSVLRLNVFLNSLGLWSHCGQQSKIMLVHIDGFGT
jgi:hypothetical protein